jgi:hypothetical protein
MSQYNYAALSAHQIRLLRLMPPPENETTERANLQCEVFAYSLHDECRSTHQYEALSYTWGGEKKPRSIFIGNQKLDVTENLHAALSRLRCRYLARIVWVDAICINQTSEEERSQQVQLMAMIYSKAYCVIVWLGEIADDVRGALECIQCATNEELIQRSNRKTNELIVFNLLQRQWFQRIWVGG